MNRSLPALRPSLAPVALRSRSLVATTLALLALAGCGSSDDRAGEPGGQGGSSAGSSGTSGQSGQAGTAAGTTGTSGQGGAGGAGQGGAGAAGQGGSQGGGAGAPSLDLKKLSPSCFQGGTTPDLKLGDQFKDATWNDPHLLKVGGTFWMYASSNQGVGTTTPVQPYRLTSSDSTHWTLDPTTPVLTAGADGAWDHGGVETPAVVSFKGVYHLFYTGYAAPHGSESPLDYRVGHATSPDGLAWTRGAAPILAPSDPKPSFAQYIVGEPAPVVVGDTLHLYFTAVGVDKATQKTLQTIGLITSTDGTTWSEPVLALSPDQTLYPRTDNWVGYSTPNAIVLGGQVHLFVDVANDHGKDTWTQEALHHAWSADGRTGWTQDTAPLRRKTDFTWTAREIRSPAALLDGTTLRLSFAGDNYPKAFGIGQMTCSLAP